MGPSRIHSLALISALGLLLACGDESDVLIGTWQTGRSSLDVQQFDFQPGGKARWQVRAQGQAQSFDLRYRLSTKNQPWSLDLTGFENGPMAGGVMLCIAEMPSPEELNLECWPAEPNQGNTARPKKLGPSAVHLTKAPS